MLTARRPSRKPNAGTAGDRRAASETALRAALQGGFSSNVVWSTEPFSAQRKTERANDYLKSLPEDALLVRADLDEFMDPPPEAVERAARGHGFVRGLLVDRVARGWALAKVTEAPIWEQFPVRTRDAYQRGAPSTTFPRRI